MILSNKIAKFTKTILTGTLGGFLALAVAGTVNTNLLPTRVGEAFSSEKIAANAPSSPEILHPSFVPNYVKAADTLRHWDKPVVTVYVDPSGDPSQTAQQVVDSVTKGLSLWNAKLSSAVKLETTTDADDADINITFVAPGSLSGGAIGRTDVTFRLDDQVLTHAAVRINRSLPAAQLVQVSAHELGHALGVQGHSPDKRDLMYAYAHLPAEITERDLNTMEVSYKVAPNGTNPVAMNVPAHRTLAAVATATETDSAAEFAAPAAH